MTIMGMIIMMMMVTLVDDVKLPVYDMGNLVMVVVVVVVVVVMTSSVSRVYVTCNVVYT